MSAGIDTRFVKIDSDQVFLQGIKNRRWWRFWQAICCQNSSTDRF